MAFRKRIAVSVVVLASCSTSCSTALLNTNTLDLAATIDDLAIRQIVYNLVKTRENQYALPSQVQINGGQVTARTSVTPTIAAPFNSALTGTAQVASQVVAASGALTTTTTGIDTKVRPNSSAGISGVLEDQQNWSVIPVQDPEQLRRLRLLYQYGTQNIDASDLLCLYPIPERPVSAGQKTDLQILAEALSQTAAERAAKTAAEKVASDAGSMSPDEIKKMVNAAAQDAARKAVGAKYPANNGGGDNKKIRYIRGYNPGTCANVVRLGSPHRAQWTLVGMNSDPAFLTHPGCVLCAYPVNGFARNFGPTSQIFESRVSERTEAYNSKYEYVPVVVNDALLPDAVLVPGGGDPYAQAYKVDWMSVVQDGAESVPPDSRRVGGANGYSVYVYPVAVNETTHYNGDRHFSEFVLAIIEATLQSPQIQKAGPAPPINVQTAPPVR